jgi:hypothetical protein
MNEEYVISVFGIGFIPGRFNGLEKAKGAAMAFGGFLYREWLKTGTDGRGAPAFGFNIVGTHTGKAEYSYLVEFGIMENCMKV